MGMVLYQEYIITSEKLILLLEMQKMKVQITEPNHSKWNYSSITEFSNDQTSKYPQLIFSDVFGFSEIIVKQLHFVLQENCKIFINPKELEMLSNSQFPFSHINSGENSFFFTKALQNQRFNWRTLREISLVVQNFLCYHKARRSQLGLVLH